MSDIDVTPWNHYLSEYAGKHQILLRSIEESSLPIPERMRLYEDELSKLKEEFREKRKLEYESKSIELSVSHSCSKGHSGGVKNCGFKCVSAPRPGMYTMAEWVRHEGTSKGIEVSDTQACIKMTRASKGANRGTLFAKFAYKPTFIDSTIRQESAELFNIVLTQAEADDYVDERSLAYGDFRILGITSPDS